MLDIAATKQIHDQLAWRYATKAFDAEKKLPDATWAALEASLRMAPSSFGLQPWKFVVVDSPELRERLAETTAPNRAKIVPCAKLVVLARLKHMSAEYIDAHFALTAATRGIDQSVMAAYQGGVVAKAAGMSAEAQATWHSRQVYIALGFVMASAAALGVDSCPMEGFDPAKFDDILGLTDTNYASVVMVALGYRAESDATQHAAKVRKPASDVFITL